MLHLKRNIYVLEPLIHCINFLAAIAAAIEKWKAEKEARLAGGGGTKDVEEEEEYIYAVKDNEVITQAEYNVSDCLHSAAQSPVCFWCNESRQNIWSVVKFRSLNTSC